MHLQGNSNPYSSHFNDDEDDENILKTPNFPYQAKSRDNKRQVFPIYAGTNGSQQPNRCRRAVCYGLAFVLIILVPLVAFGFYEIYAQFKEAEYQRKIEQQKLNVQAMQSVQSALTNAIYKDDAAEVKDLLDKVSYLDVNWRHNVDMPRYVCKGWPRLVDATPLHLATACNKSTEIVRALLQHGANVNSQGRFLPIHYASGNGNADVVQLLLDRGAEIERQLKVDEHFMGYTPLLMAIRNGHFKVVQDLVERGADLLARSDKGETVLELAMRYNFKEILRYLLENFSKISQGQLDDAEKRVSAAFKEKAELAKQYFKGSDPWAAAAMAKAEEWLAAKEPVRDMFEKAQIAIKEASKTLGKFLN